MLDLSIEFRIVRSTTGNSVKRSLKVKRIALTRWLVCVIVQQTLLVCLVAGCCTPLAPRAIPVANCKVSPEILAATEVQIERGQPRKVIDGIGWVIGIPSKILLWDRRVENHRISSETEIAMQGYLAVNDLQHVKVRLNQYHPRDDWYRLTQNRSVGWGWRYTLGTLSVLGETLLPGRIFGGDHFNPFTNTIHLYSDVPAIAWHEAAHAKDFTRRQYPGTYAAIYVLPIVPLWHESIASSDVFAYVETLDDLSAQIEAHQILYPAYATYVGNALGGFAPKYANPLYYGSILAGHGIGRWKASRIEKASAASHELHFDSHHRPHLATPQLQH
jgi:hypothetical protein